MNPLKNLKIDRFKEPSTWAALGTLALFFGAPEMPDGWAQDMAQGAGGLGLLLAVLMRDPGSAE